MKIEYFDLTSMIELAAKLINYRMSTRSCNICTTNKVALFKNTPSP